MTDRDICIPLFGGEVSYPLSMVVDAIVATYPAIDREVLDDRFNDIRLEIERAEDAEAW